ncbi:hypothetical protein F5Y04DRAFT_255358 [Hypomontagnella monticulosa]|nr:hypothetical protein F5Y04DRAFT_255358 [Hypomontagnella monticulosa]
MSTSKQDRSISERSRNVKTSLIALKSQIETKNQDGHLPIRPETIDDILDRYLLWAGNLGALHLPTSRLSLDQRLLPNPEIRDEICDFLDDLQEAIDDLTDIVLGNSHGGGAIGNGLSTSSDSPKPADEVRSFLEVISQCIRSLFRIGILVRKKGQRDRFQQALQQPSLSFLVSPDIDYVRHKYPKLRAPASEWLAERVGNANAKRRQYIKYCRDHKTRLGTVPDERRQTIITGDDADAYTDLGDRTTVNLSSKATTLLPIGSTEFRQLEINIREEDDRASLFSVTTASTTFDSATNLKLPSLEELSPNLEPFECPVCLMLQSFRREKAWKAHALRDLKAYVCTIGGDECGNELFNSRDTWFDHELKHHRSNYTCPLCKQEFIGKASMESHVASSHGGFEEDQISMLVEAGREVPTHFKASDCPFCDEWAEALKSRAHAREESIIQNHDHTLVPRSRFKRHVATHQEQLAIFVVPRSTEDDEEDGIGSAKSDASGSMTKKDEKTVVPPNEGPEMETEPEPGPEPDSDLAAIGTAITTGDDEPRVTSRIQSEFSEVAAAVDAYLDSRLLSGPVRLARDALPNILFSGLYDNSSKQPCLFFSPIFRILPTGGELIRVGRYSEREEYPLVPTASSHAINVGFKSKVVSRSHCEFWCEGGKWYIKDVKSSSGTFLNTIRLSAPGRESRQYPIHSGDVVQLGINFEGGEKKIYRCVKMEVQVNISSQWAEKDSHDALKWCREIGMDTESPDFRFDSTNPITGMTPIHSAIQAENIEILRQMLSHVPYIEPHDIAGSTPLHVAASTLNKQICLLLLDYGANIEARDDNGMTPLHRCQTESGGTQVAQLLLSRFPGMINKVDDFNETALHMACRMNNEEMVECLLTHNADPNIRGPEGYTPLRLAVDPALSQSQNTDIVELLIRHGADPKILGKDGGVDTVDKPGGIGKVLERVLNLGSSKDESSGSGSKGSWA